MDWAVWSAAPSCIAEDFVTGFLIHKKGWRSLYIPKILARGLAPEDFSSYLKQQSRWARGALDLLFSHNLLFCRGLTFSQKMQYLASVSYFLSGWVVLIDALIPVVFFFTGLFPFETSTMLLAVIFLPYMFITLYSIQRSCNFSYTYKALSFSLSGFNVHLASSLSAFFRTRSSFSITPKRGSAGNYTGLILPQIFYMLLVACGAIYSYAVWGATPSWITNLSWGSINVALFLEYSRGAFPQKQAVRVPIPPVVAAKKEKLTWTTTVPR